MPNRIRGSREASDDDPVDVLAPFRRRLLVGKRPVNVRGVRPERDLALRVGIAAKAFLPFLERQGAVFREGRLNLADILPDVLPEGGMFHLAVLELIRQDPNQLVDALAPRLDHAWAQLGGG